jgi:hypothetical protein
MRRICVMSPDLASVGYDPNRRILEIEFNWGGVYRYYDVDEDVHRGLMNADSSSKFFDKNIKRAGFKYEKVE